MTKLFMSTLMKIKGEFLEVLNQDYEILMGYQFKMKVIYRELDEPAAIARKHVDYLLIISGHGMKPYWKI